jgi:hypothetical protein
VDPWAGNSCDVEVVGEEPVFCERGVICQNGSRECQ